MVSKNVSCETGYKSKNLSNNSNIDVNQQHWHHANGNSLPDMKRIHDLQLIEIIDCVSHIRLAGSHRSTSLLRIDSHSEDREPQKGFLWKRTTAGRPFSSVSKH